MAKYFDVARLTPFSPRQLEQVDTWLIQGGDQRLTNFEATQNRFGRICVDQACPILGLTASSGARVGAGGCRQLLKSQGRFNYRVGFEMGIKRKWEEILIGIHRL